MAELSTIWLFALYLDCTRLCDRITLVVEHGQFKIRIIRDLKANTIRR